MGPGKRESNRICSSLNSLPPALQTRHREAFFIGSFRFSAGEASMTKTEKLLCELIALPSVNPAFLPPGNPFAGEQKVAGFLAATAARAGLNVELQPALPQRSNLLIRLPS